MKREHLTNREPIGVETVKPGETIENVQICPVGDFPNGDREQHCTLKVLENVVAKWKEDGEVVSIHARLATGNQEKSVSASMRGWFQFTPVLRRATITIFSITFLITVSIRARLATGDSYSPTLRRPG